MRKIFLIRHAESEGNVGNTFFPHNHIVKITEKGKTQAKDLAEILDKPDKIYVSKFIRTIETAEPTIKKFPEADVHVWFDVHEFGHISPKTILETTQEELQAKALNFWKTLDPMEKDTEHEESFQEFVDRIAGAIGKMQKLESGVHYIFTHGWVVKLFTVLRKYFPNFDSKNATLEDYKKIMQKFVDFDKEFQTKNTGVYEVTEML